MENPSELRPLDADEYTIATPENVTFDYQVAGIGSRFIGALIDTLAIAILLFLLNVIVIVAMMPSATTAPSRRNLATIPAGWRGWSSPFMR